MIFRNSILRAACASTFSTTGIVLNRSNLTNCDEKKRNDNYTVHATKTACVAKYVANDPYEDRYYVHEGKNLSVIGIFDGHGGWNVSDFSSRILVPKLLSKLANKPLSDSTVDSACLSTFQEVEDEYIKSIRRSYKLGFGGVASVGSCANIAIKQGNRLSIANCGDCRAVLGSEVKDDVGGGKVYVASRLSRDHNARVPLEVLNLTLEHPGEEGLVRCKHPSACYVKGRLQLTRSLGDLYLKHDDFNATAGQPRASGRHIPAPYTPPYVSHVPDITHIRLDAHDRFLIVASDGLWDFLSDEEAVAIVSSCEDKADAANKLVEVVLQKAAEECGATVQQLKELPLGSARRRRHDDTTAAVLYF